MKKNILIASATIAGACAVSPYAAAAGNGNGNGNGYDEMQREIEILHNEIKKLKSSQNHTAVKAHKGPSIEISGHINRALQYLNDGDESNFNNVDNDNSATRLRVIADAPLTEELSLGGALEVQLESNSTASINQLNEDQGNGSQSFSDRRAEIYLTHDRYGKLWLGQGWTASDGSAEYDLSGTWLASGSYVGSAAGALFRDKNGQLDATKLGKLASNLDGLGRDDRIRYDTPAFNGFSLATSAVQGGAWDSALRYVYNNDSFKLHAAIAYADASSNNVKDWDSTTSGSVAVRFANGWNWMASASSRELKSNSARAAANADPSHLYTKLGYQAELLSIGKTSFSVDYRLSQDQQQANEDIKGYGIQAVQTISQYGTDLYLGINRYERNAAGKQFEPVTVALAGARVKF